LHDREQNPHPWRRLKSGKDRRLLLRLARQKPQQNPP